MRAPKISAPAALAILAAAATLAGCEGMIDPNAELDPRVMESPDVDSGMEANYPRGSAAPYQGEREY